MIWKLTRSLKISTETHHNLLILIDDHRSLGHLNNVEFKNALKEQITFLI